jgi:dTDP-4-dehydrorhamnose 3,5-epimerase
LINGKKLKISDTNFHGLKLIEGVVFQDERGLFFKNFNLDLKNTLMPHPVESYFSRSVKGAIRGLHFQRGKYSQAKLVFCVSGSFIDLATDLRRDSKTFGKTFVAKLDANLGQGIFLPVGFAHGICSLEDNTEMVAVSSAQHSPEDEGGVLWSSLDVVLPLEKPIVSTKDAELPRIEAYIANQSLCF